MEDLDYKYHDMLNSGDMYDSVDDELLSYQHALVQRLNEFNATPETPEGLALRDEMLRDMLGTYGEDLYIIPPIYANFGLRHLHVGKGVFINFNASLVDDGDIFIGDDTMIGPCVKIATAVHPISPALRRHKIQYNKPVHVGQNVWIGAGATILPGVTIGDNSIIGGGAVVTKDIPSNCIAVGVPARVVREIDENDDAFEDGRPIPQEIINAYMGG